MYIPFFVLLYLINIKILMRRFLLTLLLPFLLAGVADTQAQKRQMRAAWIATVANIDWPTAPGLPSSEQRKELIMLLDSLQALNFNAVVLQIRPTADAFYPSSLEPWSYYLTGRQGQRPDPYYDPLSFAVEEAHHRCMDVHVWINPYRVTLNNKDFARTHIRYQHPEWFVTYAGKEYFNPGLDETVDWLERVVADIVQRYDIDAIHMDDYFYPYRVAGEEFPDEQTFRTFPRGFKDKNDWRRNNVDRAIERIHNTIQSLKPWVEFGISPFGVWRNKSSDPEHGSDTRAGIQNYDDLYADILKWLREGMIDYVCPQLYWEIGKKVADYSVLTQWWSENSFGQNLYIGLFASGLGNKNAARAWTEGNELCRQMRNNQKHKEIDGVIMYSARPLLRNPLNICDSLSDTFFHTPALPPQCRNIQGDASARPEHLRVLHDNHVTNLEWSAVHEEDGCQVRYYVVYAFQGKEVGDLDDPANILCKTAETCVDISRLISKSRRHWTFVVTSVNRYKQESQPSHPITHRI